MEIYSTMSREKEELNTLFEDKIKLFVCGPTVYDDAHIGHLMTGLALFADVLGHGLEVEIMAGHDLRIIAGRHDIRGNHDDRVDILADQPAV